MTIAVGPTVSKADKNQRSNASSRNKTDYSSL